MNLQSVLKLKKRYEDSIKVLLEKRKGEQAELNEQQKVIQSDIDTLERLKNGKA